jgi:cyclic-di-GMP-binding protein
MSVTQPPVQSGGPSFTDARGCKDWLAALPLTNIPQAQALVLESLRALNQGDLDGLERLKCVELMRDKIAFLQGEQRSRYFGKTLPLSANDNAAWTTGCTLLQEMETAYRACLADTAANPALASHAPLVSQRVVRYIGAQMLFHAAVYRRFDPELWLRLHQQYRDAETAGFANDTVKDSLEGGDEGTSSPAEAYVQVVLIQAAYLSEMTAPQMDFAEALIRLWLRKVRVLSAPKEAGAPGVQPLVVDLSRSIGARPLSNTEVGEQHRILDVEGISSSLRKRIHGLQNDEDPASLGLPPQVSGLDPLSQMQRLRKLWCEGAPPRPPARESDVKAAGLVFGVPEIHFFVTGGKIFEQPDKKRELTRQEKQDIEVFGQVTERTQSRMLAEYNFTVESWPVIDEMRGAWRLQRPASTSRGVAIGRLVAMRMGDTAPFYLGMVSALSQETDGRIIITVTLFPGRPQALPVRAADARNRANAKWVEAFRLPALEKANIPASLVVPNGVASRGRGIELWQGEGDTKETTVYEMLEHGTDFDRITTF